MNEGKILMLPVGMLVSDEKYQRPINKAHVNTIINNFNWRKVDPIKVSHRDGNYYVYDGQHTVVAIRAKFGDEQRVPCNVQEGLTWEEEAYLFASQDDGVTKVSVADKFRANYRRGEETAVDIVNICEKYGITIKIDSVSRGNFKTAAVSTLNKFYKKLGKELFEESVSLVASTWGGITDSMSRKIFTAVFIFVKTYQGEYKKGIAIRKWKPISIPEIVSIGDTSAVKGEAKYAKVLLDFYNKGSALSDRLMDKF